MSTPFQLEFINIVNTYFPWKISGVLYAALYFFVCLTINGPMRSGEI